MAIKTVAQLGRLLCVSDPTMAARHLRLVLEIRESQAWPADAEAIDLRAGLPVREDGPADLDVMRQWWADRGSERQAGVVDRLLSHGGAGFIKPDDGGDAIFFSRPKTSTVALPAPGTRVTYEVAPSFDAKKNKATVRATDVKRA